MLKERTKISELLKKVDTEVILYGWVDTKRDHGKITFIDLRDTSGRVQCVGVGKMGDLTPESVVMIQGKVQKRPDNMVNSEIPFGDLEIFVEGYEVLNKCGELPIPVQGDGREINEESRFKYRYLDLRRERLSKNMKMRSELSQAFREAFMKRDFVEIETPMLTKSTKEGARDFIVPSRYFPGKFFALPQAPQQYKQLLMTAGFERYFQMARCIRDEDLRADRGYEFTQVDIEMSFVTRDEIMEVFEGIVKDAAKAVGGKLKDETFPVVSYADAIEKYGDDKFDLRTPEEKKNGTLAFAWVVDFPFFKKVDKKDAAEVEDGKSGWTFTHNPFSAPKDEHLDQHMSGENVGEILTSQYDLVCNGYEVGGGSIRAHKAEVLEQTYKIMGYSNEQIQENVGHMLEAFRLGTPPHGGIAFGFDRLVMLLAGEESLKEGIPFPMTSSGRTSVMDAPSPVTDKQLKELGIKVVEKK